MAATIYDPVVLINDARNYASRTLDAGINELNAVQYKLETLLKAATPPTSPTIPLEVPEIEVPGDAPRYMGSVYSKPQFNAPSPQLQEMPTDGWPQPPTAAEPSIPRSLLATTPQPDGDPGVLNATPPVVNTNFIIPPDPNLMQEIKGIPVPELTPLVMPDAPIIQEPVFDGILPVLNIDPPTADQLEQTMKGSFADGLTTMRSSIVDQIQQFIQTKWPGLAGAQAQLDKFLAGGTGFKPEVEDAIFNRTLDKTNNEGKRASAKAWGEAARAGFTIPSAILLSQQQDIDQERRNLNARAAIDIAIKQAELEQANLQFATQQSVNMVQIIANAAVSYIGSLVAINGHAVEYARSIVDSVVKGYDIAAKYAEIQSRIYEAQAKVYEVKWEGVKAQIEAYRGEIAALQAQAQVDEARVSAYKARIDAVQAEAQVYRSQIDAVVAAAGIEKMKVDLYTAQVQAYAAQINAYTAKWQGYEAVARADVSRFQVTESQYRIWLERYQAYETEVRAISSKLESASRVNEALVRQYGVQADVFKTQVTAEAEGIRAETSAYEAQIRAYTADAEAKASKYRSEVAAWEATVRSLVAQVNILIEQMREENNRAVAIASSVSQIGAEAGRIYAQTAQSALSGINSLASVATSV